MIKEKYNEYSITKEPNVYMQLQNYIVVFMIALINLQQKYNFVIQIFQKDSKLMHILYSTLKLSNEVNGNSNRISKILCNLFLDEYKEMFFLSSELAEDESLEVTQELTSELEQLFIYNNEKFSKINIEGLDIYPKQLYTLSLEYLKSVDISFEVIFENGIKSGKITESQKSESKFNLILVKCRLPQAVIRTVFSQEKFNYISSNKEEDKSTCYEFIFMKNCIARNMIEVREKFGDNYTCLFRKEEFFDEVIKYYFFIFGNSMLIKCFGTNNL